jgi:hypothetical protein
VRERITLTGHDGQPTVFYGLELTPARARRGCPAAALKPAALAATDLPGSTNKVKVIKRRTYGRPSFDGFREPVLLARPCTRPRAASRSIGENRFSVALSSSFPHEHQR